MSICKKKKIVILILDGVGYSKSKSFNSTKNSHKPFFNSITTKSKTTLLYSSGNYVGLPKGQIGNSEVGHVGISSGRVVNQYLNRINYSIKYKYLKKNKNLQKFKSKIDNNENAIHIMGLLSNGGIHSHENHFVSILKKISKKNNKVNIHIFTDGRDCGIKSAYLSIKKIEKHCTDKIKIVSVTGRYYAMDRKKNWHYTKLVYDMLTTGSSIYHYKNVFDTLKHAYIRKETDEFIYPSWCGGNEDYVKNNDNIIFLNFRLDRIKQIKDAFVNINFDNFKIKKSLQNIFISNIVQHGKSNNILSIFNKSKIKNTLGQFLSVTGIKQIRISEIEKYSHISYFFNGLNNKKFLNEKHIIYQSDKIKSYDLKPEMKSVEITNKIIKNINKFDITICNYPNADMIGHTGNYYATVKTSTIIDYCLNKLYYFLNKMDVHIFLMSDHGNSEHMFDIKKKKINTSHTNNLIPFIYLRNQLPFKHYGYLTCISPTIISLLNTEKPYQMKSENLFENI